MPDTVDSIGKKFDSLTVDDLAYDGQPGIVTVSEWLRAPDGRTYMAFFASDWRPVKEQVMGSKIPRANAGFFFVCGPESAPIMVIPGCRFSSYTRAEAVPGTVEVFDLTFFNLRRSAASASSQPAS